MIQRGRKSAAGLAVVTPLPGQRTAAPKSLSEAEAAVWRAVVATKPADWFSADSHPLLIAYCRHAAMADLLSDHIGEAAKTHTASVLVGNVGAAALALAGLDALLKMRDRETKALNTFARAMRLTQQSRLKAETAATAHGRANGTSGAVKKPWDTD